jgi:predicted O-methyltransferase YrrM
MLINKKNYNKIIKSSKVEYIYKNIINIISPRILEFGVREGISTFIFLYVCKKKNGKLISVDINDPKNLFKDKNWAFFKTRDDNYEFIKTKINKLDVINIDSFHEPNHVTKLIYLYYFHLKINGFFLIDDISWLPYVKNSHRPNSFNENINKKTFNALLEIFFNNQDRIGLEFSFEASGTAKLIKKNNKPLRKPIKMKSSNNKFKSFIKSFYSRKPKK